MATWTNATKNTATWANATNAGIGDFLLMEDGGAILQENGDEILLQTSTETSWSYPTKN